MYLIINDIYSIYFPYFRLFLNCLLVDYVMSAVLNNQLPEKAKEYANFFTGDIEGLRDALRSRIKLMGRRPTDWS